MGLLNHTQARILRQALVDMNLGINPNNSGTSWQISAPDELSSPDQVITVGNTAGVLEGNSQLTGEIYEARGIQVKVRTSPHAYDSGSLKTEQLRQALDETLYNRHVVVDGTTYCIQSFERTGAVLETGSNIPNDKRRLFFINGLLRVSQLS